MYRTNMKSEAKRGNRRAGFKKKSKINLQKKTVNEMSNLHNKKFKVVVIKMLTELRKRMDEQREL